MRIDDDLDNLSRVTSHYGWSRKKDGLVKFTDDRASAEFLKLRLGQVRLTKIVNLEDAVNQLLRMPQVTHFLEQHRIDLEPVFTGATIWNQKAIEQLSNSPRAPKYALTLDDVTVEEALDRIVRTFPGVWVYSECLGRITLTSDPVGSPRPAKK